jgi:hypothetical protein
MVSINKTRVKINLKKLKVPYLIKWFKEMETDKFDMLEVDNLDLYRTRNQTKNQVWDLRKRIKKD